MTEGASNEVLSAGTNGGDIFMRSLIGAAAFGIATDDLDLDRLSPGEAAEYL